MTGDHVYLSHIRDCIDQIAEFMGAGSHAFMRSSPSPRNRFRRQRSAIDFHCSR